MLDINNCPCKSGLSFSACCGRYIQSELLSLSASHMSAPSPEALMRSRYTAYAIKAFDYIANTYASSANPPSIQEIAEGADETEWVNLNILKSSDTQVEFQAFYRIGNRFFLLQELSDFVIEQGQWKYISGEIHKNSGVIKPQRNEACICGSGKKFKRCCGA